MDKFCGYLTLHQVIQGSGNKHLIQNEREMHFPGLSLLICQMKSQKKLV